MHGRILVWYLPRVVSTQSREHAPLTYIHVANNDVQKEANEMLSLTKGLLENSLKAGILKQEKAPWRINPRFFNSSNSVQGCFNLSPGWFMQAHEVSPECLRCLAQSSYITAEITG
jgi:hypothetical protein